MRRLLAAETCNCAPWELDGREHWENWALIYRSARNRAQGMAERSQNLPGIGRRR